MIAQKEWLSRFASLLTANPSDNGLHAEERFCELLQLETKRAQRSLRPLLLMLLDLCVQKEKVMRGIASQPLSSTREIDIKRWFGEGSVIGAFLRNRWRTGLVLSVRGVEERIGRFGEGTRSGLYSLMRRGVRISSPLIIVPSRKQ
jgi:hypothetical protein